MKEADLKQSRLFKKWLFIEICFLSLMIVVSSVLYLYANTNIRKLIDELHKENLLKAQTQIEATLQAAEASVNEYVISAETRALMRLDFDENERQAVELVDDIKKTNATIPGVQEIVIYYKEQGLFLSSAGIMDDEIFSAVYLDESDKIKQTIVDKEALDRIVFVNYARQGEDMTTGLYTKTVGENVFVTAIIDNKQIRNILQDHLQDSRNGFIVCDRNFQVLFCTDELSDCDIDAANLIVYSENPQKMSDAGREYYCISSASEDTGLVYTSLISPDNYAAGFFKIQITALSVLIAAAVSGIFFSYYSTRYKYKPIKKVIKVSRAVTPQDIYLSSEDELEEIEHAIRFIQQQKNQTTKILSDHSDHIKNNSIKMILDHELEYTDLTAHVRELLNVDPQKVYTVAVLEPNAKTEITEAIQQVRFEGPENPDSKLMHVLAKGGRIIIIFDGHEKGALYALENDLDLKDIDVAAIGHEGTGFEGLRESYKSALLGISKKIIPGQQKIIPPVDEKGENTITISIEDDVRLCGYIQAGEEKRAAALLRELVDIHNTKTLDVFSYKSYLYNISSTIIRSAELIKDHELIANLLKDFNAAFKKEDHSSIKQTLEEAIITIAERYKQKMKSANDVLNDRIIKYIEANIKDSQLSADMIAEAMIINPAYLRSFFKEKNGILLWDFINMKRIEMAKDLLVTTNKSIKTISAICGFVSISTFIRAFKKFSGITPGYYRNLYR